MIDVLMTKDIRKFEPKEVGPFTIRQVVCGIIAVVVNIPIACLSIEWTTKLMIISLIAVPICLCGKMKMFGMPLEVLIMRYLYLFVLTSPKRKLKIENSYREEFKRIKKAQEKQKIRQMTKHEQKEYAKKKSKSNIKYSNKKEYRAYL